MLWQHWADVLVRLRHKTHLDRVRTNKSLVVSHHKMVSSKSFSIRLSRINRNVSGWFVCSTNQTVTHFIWQTFHTGPDKKLHFLQHQSQSSKAVFNSFISILLFSRSTAQQAHVLSVINHSNHDETMWFLTYKTQTGSFSDALKTQNSLHCCL